jgi:hypothetical protein
MASGVFRPAALLVLALFASPSAAQQPDEAAVTEFFSGQRMLVTYREGGPQYGTHFFLDVHFCRSGRYLTVGESRRRTVLDNEQVNRFTDQGIWEITTIRGQISLRYVSVSGEQQVVGVYRGPDGRISLGDGVSIVRKGPALCAR